MTDEGLFIISPTLARFISKVPITNKLFPLTANELEKTHKFWPLRIPLLPIIMLFPPLTALLDPFMMLLAWRRLIIF